MPINPPTNTLAAIQIKVRRLTRSPSIAQLTDDDLNNYINTFVVYDFPEHLRTFNLRGQFSFYTNPYQDEYPTDIASFVGVVSNPLYNFQNLYISVHDPVYIAGYQSFYSQNREQFYGIYPLVNSIASIGPAGDGITVTFSGVINSSQAIVGPGLVQQVSILQNNVLFSSVSPTGEGLALVDVPLTDPVTGNKAPIGNLYVPNALPTTPPLYPTNILANNNIDYSTGKFTITFPAPPRTGQVINSQTVPQVLTLPQALLYYNNKFVVRPVPDQPYKVNFEVFARPVFLMATNQSPQLEEWWQYIAYGAAKKILEDRMDLDSVALILPEYKKQEALCLRRSLVQWTNERTASIYSEQTYFGPGGGGWGWGGGPF